MYEGVDAGQIDSKRVGVRLDTWREGHVLTSVLSPSPCALLKDCYEGKI